MNLSAGTLLRGGTYRIVRFIDSGGFGCTYEAEHLMLQKRVAIKEFFVKDYCNRDEGTSYVVVGIKSKEPLVDKLKKKFLDEARAVSRFRHPGIVQVSDVFEENGTAYYVMDYIEGRSLKDMVKAEGPMPERRALKYVSQVAEALKYVHARNRLHLDVKPGNIMVDGSDNAILIDFGTSKQYDEESGENTSTLLGYTPGYAPPEQMSKSVVKFLPATDVYALGATLYKLLTGKTPLDANDRISGDTLEPLPAGTSNSVCRAVSAAMSLDKRQRPQSVEEFMGLLPATTSSKGSLKENGKSSEADSEETHLDEETAPKISVKACQKTVKRETDQYRKSRLVKSWRWILISIDVIGIIALIVSIVCNHYLGVFLYRLVSLQPFVLLAICSLLGIKMTNRGNKAGVVCVILPFMVGLLYWLLWMNGVVVDYFILFLLFSPFFIFHFLVYTLPFKGSSQWVEMNMSFNGLKITSTAYVLLLAVSSFYVISFTDNETVTNIGKALYSKGNYEAARDFFIEGYRKDYDNSAFYLALVYQNENFKEYDIKHSRYYIYELLDKGYAFTGLQLSLLENAKYKIGDSVQISGSYMTSDGFYGTVYSVDSTGFHGKAISNVQAEKNMFPYWGKKNNIKTSMDDGMKNQQMIQMQDNWENDFPPFYWCASLGDGWYLPSKEELIQIYNVKTVLNQFLQVKINDEPWSSYVSSSKNGDKYYWSVSMRNGREGWYYIDQKGPDTPHYVRAVVKF